MANGITSDYETIKAMPVMEFWTYFDMWYEDVQREIESNKKRKQTAKK